MRVARTASTQEVVLRAAREGAGEGFACLAGRADRRTWAPGTRLGRALRHGDARVGAAPPLSRRGEPGSRSRQGWRSSTCWPPGYGVTAGLKWPNDVLVDGRKLAGILCEVEPATSAAGRVAVALGIGVNLTVSSFPDGIEAVSLHTLVANPPPAERVAHRVGRRPSAFGSPALEQGGIGALLDDWRRCAVGLGGPVTVHAPAASSHGVAIDVGDDGALLVEASGRTHRFLAGDVHLGPSQPDGTSDPGPGTRRGR